MCKGLIFKQHKNTARFLERSFFQKARHWALDLSYTEKRNSPHEFMELVCLPKACYFTLVYGESI